jgi:DNA topoisomerase-1
MLYRLIWLRTVASQMASAEVENTTYDFMSAGLDHHWTITGEVITFDGFLVLYEKQKSDTTKEEDEIADDEQDAVLPKIAKGTNCDANIFEAMQFFSKPPSRYTESALVKALESRGIGRPSTYAPTISTIQDRGYIEKKEDKKLYPFEIAFHVNDFLDEHFKHMMNYEFTAKMEDSLDEIADGGITRQNMMKNFYTGFDKEVQEAKL